MTNFYFFPLSLLFFLTFGFSFLEAQNLGETNENQESKLQTVIYFTPELEPYLEEIKDATYISFFSAVSNRFSRLNNRKMLRIDSSMPYDRVDSGFIREICENNDANYAVVPKVKFFKVGIGKYVFSSQVVVSMKLYDSKGNLITESHYDTFRKNARILGSTENSIKIGTNGSMKGIVKNLRKLLKNTADTF